MVSDSGLLSWLTEYAQKTPTLLKYLSVPLASLALPSLYLYLSVIATKASDSVLDAMKLMSDEGVSSIAIIDDETGGLLSAVSVTDIGKVRLAHALFSAQVLIACTRSLCLSRATRSSPHR